MEPKSILRTSTILSLAALLSSCISEYEPFVMLLDDSYSLELVGTDRDGFTSPDGMLVLADGSLILADEGGSMLLRWRSSNVEVLCDSSCGIISPEDLVMDEEGDIYFTDDSAGGLWKLDREGRIHLVAGKDAGLVSTEGIALAPDGSILVGDGEAHEIFRVTPGGAVTPFLGSEHYIEKAEAMVFDDEGSLYIADDFEASVYRLDPNHSLARILDATDGIAAPESMIFMDGYLFITDNETGKLHRYDLESGELATIAIFLGNLKDIQGIASGTKGDIYISVHGWYPRSSYIFRLAGKR